MSDETLQSINKRLALLIKSVLADKLEEMTRAEQVELLESMDFRDQDIIEVLGISSNHLGTIRADMEDG